MLSEGMFASRAAEIAARRRALPDGSPPPRRAATVISLISLEKSFPLLAPIASFWRLILVQRLWPDIAFTFERCRGAMLPCARCASRGERKTGRCWINDSPEPL